MCLSNDMMRTAGTSDWFGGVVGRRRKNSLSIYQKRIRFLTVMSTALLLSAFTGLMYWMNRQ